MATTQQRHSHHNRAPEGAPRQDRAATWIRGLTELMVRRPDLAGVYRPADIAAESVRWSV